MDDSPDTHLQPSTWWLNLDERVIRRPLAGTTTDVPQVVKNYAPVDRDVWRLKAFIDNVGRPATSRLLLVRPRQTRISIACLWAVCNSPVANAYTFALGSKRDIPAGLMREMPAPDLEKCNLSSLQAAVSEYLEAAATFTKKFQGPAVKRKANVKTPRTQTLGKQMPLRFVNEPTEAEISTASERLRTLHWRVDAEVLKLYALAPELERELLDAFDAVPRVGVPFEQTHYIPREFRDVFTLDDYLRITDEWDSTEARRCELVEKRMKSGRRTAEEESEFRDLQRLLMLRRRLRSPLPTAEIKARTKQIREGGKWEEED